MTETSRPGAPTERTTEDLPRPAQQDRRGPSAPVRLAISAMTGLVVGIGVTLATSWQYGLLLGWMSAASLFLLWVWLVIGPMSAAETAAHAVREDPGRAGRDAIAIGAAVASLTAVGLLLAATAKGSHQDLAAALSLASVIVAWGTVHTVFTTRYASLYYTGDDGGIDFNTGEPPQYTDFAYLAFTIGMTFQVSDTDLTARPIRSAALRHALLSYLLGSVVLAATINLVAGLGK